MSHLTNLLMNTREFDDLKAAIKPSSRTGVTRLTGLVGPQKAFALAALAESEGSLSIMTYNQTEADSIASDMKAFLSGSLPVYEFSFKDLLPYEEASAPADLTAKRIAAMSALSRKEPGVFIFAARSAAYRLMPPEKFKSRHVELAAGDSVDPIEVLARLVEIGYERVDRCEGEAQVSFKGGVLDVMPASSDSAIRAEFFGDDLESLRLFNPDTQRSFGSLNRTLIPPAREMCPDKGDLAEGIARIKDALDKSIADASSFEDAHQRGARVAELAKRVEKHIQKLTDFGKFDNDEQYIGYFFPEPFSVLDYAKGTLLVIDEPERSRNSLRGYDKDASETYVSFADQGLVLPGNMGAHLGAGFVEMETSMMRRLEASLAPSPEEGSGQGSLREVMMSMREASFKSADLSGMIKEVDKVRRRGFSVVVALSTDERAEKVKDAFIDSGLVAVKQEGWDSLSPAHGAVKITVREISAGFISNPAKLMLLTDTELFGAGKKKKSYRQFSEGAKISSYKDLSPGDYVVHQSHGIGRYLDMKPMTAMGLTRDYLCVEYADGGKIFVPTEQVSMLQKYIGGEDMTPRLNKLGGGEWARVKERAGKAVREIAEELVRLYAARLSAMAQACGPDGPWQADFEDRFPYDETPDQLEAVRAAKEDLEKDHPMDRLVCGDVGFGKTEVALRAAFKMSAEGRQVAILAPTTILSYQHYNTFKERFEGFPVKVALLSRLTKAEDEKMVLDGISKGLVDIVIGTHRLLSKDVRFKDLGLLIVDEEQRFGVEQKEKLKMMKKDVHVLTLTATPIPRTMHMSMVGARDMSLIGTPPENRFPVRTYVTEYDDRMIREAILREIDRGGQVFYVHNRVKSINHAAEELSGLVPEARIEVAHGQMNEERLEGIIMSFLRHEFDVLVCTTIIEAGMDMPNVNTLVVNDAQKFGLAQLYQLRGRVGRSSRVAYAYLTYKPDSALSEEADKRLAAIREFSTLGSGYRIAMRDLEIRGAGNLLGREQSGHIASVGFEMYSQMLEEAVRDLKGEEPAAKLPNVSIDLPVSAFIPSSYIQDQAEKIEVYRKIGAVTSAEDTKALSEELADRFGRLPAEVVNLIDVAEIKALARSAYIASISTENEDRGGIPVIALRYREGVRLNGQDDGKMIAKMFPGVVPAPLSPTAPILMRYGGMDREMMLGTLKKLLSEIARIFLRDITFLNAKSSGASEDEAVRRAANVIGIQIKEGGAAEAAKKEALSKKPAPPKPRPRYDEAEAPKLAPGGLYNRKLRVAPHVLSREGNDGKKPGGGGKGGD